MDSASYRLSELIDALRSRPDEVMLEVGAGGELLAARLRCVIAALLLLMPLGHALGGAAVRETLIGLASAVLVNVGAQIWLPLARQARRYRWLPFATSAFDVSATSVVLLALTSIHPAAGLNSMVVWCGYVLAILLTVVRGDGRITLVAGALALVQYAALVGLVLMLTDSPERLVSSDYGTVTFTGQLQRLALLALVAVVTAIVVYRVQHLVQLSGVDGLTRLPNRSWLLQRVPPLIDAARADGGSLTVALINLDHFKRISDDAGHRAGDRAVRHVVDVLRELAEPEEWLVRMGSDEFVMLLRQPVGTAWERLETLRRGLAARPFEPDRTSDPVRITFSAGVAGYPHEGADLSNLLRRADLRLQYAKREGRNRVVARDA